MDWDAKITEICKELEIDPQLFNDNKTTQEVVSKRLGFLSHKSFIAFPDPMAVIDGRGLPLLPEHSGFQLPLGESCVREIVHQFNISRNIDDLYRNLVRFFDYVSENFQFEHAFIAIEFAVKAVTEGSNGEKIHPDFFLSDISNFRKMVAKYPDLFI